MTPRTPRVEADRAGGEFLYGSDPDKRRDDVLREVTALKPSLPAGLRSVEVQQWSAANVSVLQVALISDAAPYHELEALADRLKKKDESDRHGSIGPSSNLR